MNPLEYKACACSSTG